MQLVEQNIAHRVYRETPKEQPRKSEPYRIYFDSDGVLMDFEGYITHVFGTPYHSSDNKAEFGKKILEKSPRIYRDLLPFPEAMSVVPTIQTTLTDDIYVLTTRPHHFDYPQAASDKVESIETWYGSHRFKDIIVVKHGSDKKLFASPRSILIDDSKRNIDQWIAEGGIGILHTDWSRTLNTLYQIFRGE